MDLFKAWFIRAGLALALGLAPALAAPLFEDGKSPAWVHDALSLAAQGLLEGYPDGTFKGDRSASRWQTAMLLARLLERLHQGDGLRLSRAQLESVRRLSLQLSEELAALGTRAAVIQESVGLLDRRVQDLERITFYGRLEARMISQTFSNQGSQDYAAVVGSLAGPKLRPQTQGVVPVVDYRNGRPLTNGVGFTSLAVLGLRAKLNPDWDAEAEFAAFTSQGNSLVDAFWGVSAPYLANPFTANAAGGLGSLTNQPLTRAFLDHLTVTHRPSQTTVVLGALPTLRIEPLVYAGQQNNGFYGPRRFPGYGAMVRGQSELGHGALRWEAFATRFGNGVVYQGTNYQNAIWGGDLGYEFPAGYLHLNFARMTEDAPAGAATEMGLTSGLNVAYGQSPGWTVRQWVNPPGYFAGQQSLFQQANSGTLIKGVFQPGLVDTRPISGWNGTVDNAVGFTTGGGNYGPQDQTSYGLTGRYRFTLNEQQAHTLQFTGEWAQSHYRPNRNSSYQSIGSVLRADLEADFWKDRLILDIAYLRGDPNYQPAGWNANIQGLRNVRVGNYVGSFHLFDNQIYRHNRQGIRAFARGSFDDKHGSLLLQGEWFQQVKTSLYDVRALPSSLGPGLPNFPVIGFSPGYIESLFYGYAHPNQYGPGSANSFTDTLQPLEDPRGHESRYGLTLNYRWDDPKVDLLVNAESAHYLRSTRLSPALGGSQNQVDLKAYNLSLGVGWQVADDLKLLGSLDYVSTRGHLDPAGLFNSYALASGSSTFNTLDSTQWIPGLGLEWQFAKDTLVDLSVRHYTTQDHIESGGPSAHPLQWQGWAINSGYSMKF